MSGLTERLKAKIRTYVAARTRPERTLPYPTVNLTAWSPKDGGVNFGDELSRIVTMLMLARAGMTFDDEALTPTQLLAIGSVLHLAGDDAVVWGSGRNGKLPSEAHAFKSLDVRAVRGPLTREFLVQRGVAAPEVYGDPALLLPLLTAGRFKTGGSEICFVPNLNDVKHGVALSAPAHVALVSPMQSWHRCVAAIANASFVVATSLHGVIVAEAFGVPARYVRLSEHENLFKFSDYYAGTGRENFQYATSIEEGLEMGGERPLAMDMTPLIDAFPYDLWVSYSEGNR